MPKFLPLAFVISLLFAAGCNKQTATPDEPEQQAVPEIIVAPVAPDYEKIARDAVIASTRPEADLQDDQNRRPMKVLAFIKIEPGLTVLELEAGTGYYTELLSQAVGETGKIWMQNPGALDDRIGAQVVARLKDNRLANVTLTKSLFDRLEPADGSVDIVTWMLGPHELYFTFPGTDGFGDPATAYAEIYRVLKPGGRFVVLDHAAPKGAPKETGGETHRIDPEIVISMAVAAGFTPGATSGALSNAADDRSKGVFDPSIRRKTDRFLIRFNKPLTPPPVAPASAEPDATAAESEASATTQ